MLVRISYGDGMYSYMKVDKSYLNAGDVAEVPDEVVEMWDAISKAAYLIQRQLSVLDDKLYSKQEETDEKL